MRYRDESIGDRVSIARAEKQSKRRVALLSWSRWKRGGPWLNDLTRIRSNCFRFHWYIKNDGDFWRHRLGERIPSHHSHRAVQVAQSLVKFGHFVLGLLNGKKTDDGERSYFVPFFYCFTLEIDVLLKVWTWPRGTLCLICNDGQQSVGKRSVAHRRQPLSTFLLALAVSICRGEAVAIPKCDSWKQKKKENWALCP